MSDDSLLPAAPERQDGLAVVGVFLGMLAMLGSVFAVGLGFRAVGDAKRPAAGAATVSSGVMTLVTLSEFKIEPATLSAAPGSMLDVTNKGTTAHNLSVKGTGLHTTDIAPGGTEMLDLSTPAAGDYTVICAIPGHDAAGMTALLHVTGIAPAVAASTPITMSAGGMDAAMKARTAAFPAKTAGAGALDLGPTVLADGTKEFDFTASVFPWEVEPGKTVQAWGYNKMVPGPTIRVDDGDRVKVVLHNQLPESTVIHFHGLVVPNAMDGVPDITQPPVKPGDTFTYTFVAHGPAVAMYHSHHDAATQVTNGLLGAFYVGHLPLPAGTPALASDTPMVLNDAGTIGFSLNGKSFPATAPVVAKQGDWIKVDYMNEGLQIHPMHLHGMPQLVVARDGYPLTNPETEDTVLVAPGQRVSVLVHATEKGTWAWHCHILTHAERSDGMFGMVTALVVQ